MLDLRAICKKQQAGLESITDPNIIKSLTKYEDTVNDAYQGRLLFELIQNARDAAYKAGMSSCIVICMEGDTVYVGNTGGPFDEKGITAMTRLGVSDKSDNKTIGHKGIGFKAIQEYTSTPKIITRFGSIVFDKTELHKKLQEKFPGDFIKIATVPLFYYPHYHEKRIEHTNVMLDQCETVIEFNFNKDKTPDQFIDKFREISNEELILLQNIESISFYSDTFNQTTTFSYIGDQVTVNNNETFEIISFTAPVLIPDEVYEKLSEKEQELFEFDREIDLKVVFRLENGLPVIEPNSKLYLFYPLEMESGFPYKIHSYFSCNPQRTSITESPLNNLIFDKITELQIERVFPYLKSKGKKEELLQFVAFLRKDKKLTLLYDSYLQKIREQKFIWVEHLQDYYSPEKIILCDKDAYSFLKNYTINNKNLLVVNNNTSQWLADNFNVSKLNEFILRAHIEVIAEREKGNPMFFETLYQYISDEGYTLNDKKILLGEDNNLYEGADKVFMHGNRQEIHIPQSIQNKITMLHPYISMENISSSSLKKLGIKPFNQEDIVDRALELFGDKGINKSDIIVFLMGIKVQSPTILNNIRYKVLVPVVKDGEWISPLYDPVYIESENLKILYPEGHFINYDAIEYPDRDALNTFFLQLNVWNIPSLYYVRKNTVSSSTTPNHISFLNKNSGFNSTYYILNNDRKLDFPDKVNEFFFRSIIENWSRYTHIIESKELMPFSVISSGATYSRNIDPKATNTSFGHQLRDSSWIKISDSYYTHSEVIGISRTAYLQERHIKIDSFNWLVLDYKEYQLFFNNLGIAHINSSSPKHMRRILAFIEKKYADLDGHPSNPEFKRFYHTVLKYIYTYYELNKNGQFINELKEEKFLCIYHKDNVEYFSWQMPGAILYINNTKLYQNLTEEAKINLGYFYTKSDKNEIGKIFNQISHRLTERINEKIVYGSLSSEKLLYPEINNLLHIILLIEDKTEENIKDDTLKKLLQVKIRITSSIIRQTSIMGKNNIIVQLEKEKLQYHFNASENSIYIDQEYTDLSKNKKLFAEMVNDLISTLFQKDFDLKLYIRDLMMTTNSDSFRDAMKDIDYDKNRLEELKEILDDNQLNEEQILWDAIIKCKCPENTVSPFPKFAKIDWEALSNILTIPLVLLQQWHSKFEYTQYNSACNLPISQEIVRTLDLDFGYLNELLGGKLNFQEIYNNQFNQYKNRYSDTLKYDIYESLQAKNDDTAQSTFASFTDDIDNIFPSNLSPATLFFSPEIDYQDKVTKIISGFGYSTITTFCSNRSKQWQQLQRETALNRNNFIKRVKKEETDWTHAESFITENEHYSLLYFGKAKRLISIYVQQYPPQEEDTRINAITVSTESMIEEDNKDIMPGILQSRVYAEDPFEGPKIPKSKSPGGGYTNPMLINGDNADKTGKTGEWLLFNKLSKKYDGRVTWVSEYAKYFGYQPNKSAVGYDMYYNDENNNTHYVEVKTSSGTQPEFHITINEIKTAIAYGNRYHIIWITDVYSETLRKYTDLGNIFVNFEKEEENFFYNSRFKPILTGFKIIFTLQANRDNSQ